MNQTLDGIVISEELKKFFIAMEKIDKGSVAAYFNNCRDPKKALLALNESVRNYSYGESSGMFNWSRSWQGPYYWGPVLRGAYLHVTNE